MNRKLFTSVLLTLALAVVVAPTASPSARSFSSGHFALVVGGQVVYQGPGEVTSANTLALGGPRTAALESWARSGDLRNASLVDYEGSRVVTYSVINAWPKLEAETVTFVFQQMRWLPPTG
jgi:hypothetical protein